MPNEKFCCSGMLHIFITVRLAFLSLLDLLFQFSCNSFLAWSTISSNMYSIFIFYLTTYLYILVIEPYMVNSRCRSQAGPSAACSNVLESMLEESSRNGSDRSAGVLLVQAEAPSMVSSRSSLTLNIYGGHIGVIGQTGRTSNWVYF